MLSKRNTESVGKYILSVAREQFEAAERITVRFSDSRWYVFVTADNKMDIFKVKDTKKGIKLIKIKGNHGGRKA